MIQQSQTLRALLPGDAGAEGAQKTALAEIDASCRVPVLFFFISGLAWLLAGTVLALVASIKLHTPGCGA